MSNHTTPASLATAFVEVKRDSAPFVSIDTNAIKEIAFFSSVQRVKGIERSESDVDSKAPGMLAIGIAGSPRPKIRENVGLYLYLAYKGVQGLHYRQL